MSIFKIAHDIGENSSPKIKLQVYLENYNIENI